jgi:hypothetical protein
MSPGGRYHLQVIGGSQVYGPVRGAGAITFSAIRLDLPTVGAPCQSRRRFTVQLPRSARTAKVWVAGKRVKVRGRHGHLRVRVNMRQRQRVTVKIVSHGRSGKLHRTTRVYRRC